MKTAVDDLVFRALADPTRRAMLDVLTESPGLNVNELSSRFPMSRIGVMKHLRVLEDARLVVSERDGRNRRLYFNVVPIQQIYERWTTRFSGLWAGRLTRLKDRLEQRSQTDAQPKPKPRRP